MKERNTKVVNWGLKGIGGVLLLISILLSCYCVYRILKGDRLVLSGLIRMVMPLGALFLAGSILLVCGIADRSHKRIIITTIKWLLFFGYSFCIFILLLWSRSGYVSSYQQISLALYIKSSVNLIPFHTIGFYLYSLIHDSINMDTIMVNLLGNFILFLPMGIFLPCLSRKLRFWPRFLITMFLMLCMVELMQFITRSGSMDIDDIILNMAGACVGFALMKTRWMTRFCERIYVY